MLDYNLLEKFVINLKRRPDRLKRFLDSCPLNHVNVIYGFDGKHLKNESSGSEKAMMVKLKSLRPGEGGVFISHLRIYQKMVENNWPFALIFEDDAIFCEGFFSKCLNVLKEAPHDTDLLYIGGRFEPGFRMHRSIQISECIVRHDIKGKTWISGKNTDRTMHAYVISYRLCKLLLHIFNNSPIISCTIDDWILKECAKYDIPIYNAQPLLCHSPLISNSDIR